MRHIVGAQGCALEQFNASDKLREPDQWSLFPENFSAFMQTFTKVAVRPC
jgi:hypothetical protein